MLMMIYFQMIKALEPVERMDTIASPCISVCKLNPANEFCKGCWRTMEEIRDWLLFDRDQRLEVLGRLHDRRKAAGGRGRRVNSRRRQTT